MTFLKLATSSVLLFDHFLLLRLTTKTQLPKCWSSAIKSPLRLTQLVCPIKVKYLILTWNFPYYLHITYDLCLTPETVLCFSLLQDKSPLTLSFVPFPFSFFLYLLCLSLIPVLYPSRPSKSPLNLVLRILSGFLTLRLICYKVPSYCVAWWLEFPKPIVWPWHWTLQHPDHRFPSVFLWQDPSSSSHPFK